ncbi:MAG: hypothetical protein AAGK92_10295 [Pseudomonadota bacterium]
MGDSVLIWADYVIVGALLLLPLCSATERWFAPDEGWFIKNNRTRNLLAFALIGCVLIGLRFQDMPEPSEDQFDVVSRLITAFVRVF